MQNKPQTHSCQECRFLSEREQLVSEFCADHLLCDKVRISEEEMRLIINGELNFEDKTMNIGKFTFPGWVGHAPFYMFQCLFCSVINVDYVHGYTSDGNINGLLYLLCSNCKLQITIYSDRIYGENRVENPLKAMKEFCREKWNQVFGRQTKGSEQDFKDAADKLTRSR